MKKTYFTPEAELFRFQTEELMGPSDLTQPGQGSSSSGDDDTTTILPFQKVM